VAGINGSNGAVEEGKSENCRLFTVKENQCVTVFKLGLLLTSC
jgi:hypothetical protein